MPDFDFLRTFARKLLLKVENVYKLQFHNIDKLRLTTQRNFPNEALESIDERKVLGKLDQVKICF